MMGPLPTNVRQLLLKSKFVHLATCSLDATPHLSLMNYTFVGADDVIVLATPKNTTKFQNIEENPKVSLLVHDWVSSPSQPEGSLLYFLEQLNQNEISSVAVTLNGCATVLDGSEEKFEEYKRLHEENSVAAKAFIGGENVAFITIKISSSKVSDVDNNVNEYN